MEEAPTLLRSARIMLIPEEPMWGIRLSAKQPSTTAAAHPRKPLVSRELEVCGGGPRPCHVRRHWAFLEKLAVGFLRC